MTLKETLLATKCFVDNEYLVQYLNLVNSSEAGTELHHILPRSYFKDLGISVDNSEQNLVRLSFADHCKAHWLLYYCTTGKLKKASQASFVLMTKAFLKINSMTDPINYNLLQQKWEEFKNDSSTDFFSAEEEQFIIQNYDKLSHKQLALKLNRTVHSICQKATTLGLRTRQLNWWTEEEVQFLIKNNDKLTVKQLAEQLGKTFSGVMGKRRELGLTKNLKDYAWTQEDEQWLLENYAKLGRKKCAEILRRRASATQYHASYLGLREDQIAIYCPELNKRWKSIKAASKDLNISDTLIHRVLAGIQYQTHNLHFEYASDRASKTFSNKLPKKRHKKLK